MVTLMLSKRGCPDYLEPDDSSTRDMRNARKVFGNLMDKQSHSQHVVPVRSLPGHPRVPRQPSSSIGGAP